MQPILKRFPFSKISSEKLRKFVFVLTFLLLGVSLMGYVAVAGARDIFQSIQAQGVSIKSDTKKVDEVPAGDSPRTPNSVAGEVEETPSGATEQNSPGIIARIKSLLKMVPGMDSADVTRTWNEILVKVKGFSLKVVSQIITNGPALFIEWIVFILTFVFVFYNFTSISHYLERLDRKVPGVGKCATLFEEATRVTLLGTLVVGFCQATFVGVGSALAGFNSFLLLGMCAFFASFIPFFGVGVVWGSALIYALATGNTSSALIMLGTGVLSSLIDNLIMPTFLGANSSIHPLILFVVILGAIDMFGIWGLFIGPSTAIFSVQVIKLWSAQHMGSTGGLPKKV